MRRAAFWTFAFFVMFAALPAAAQFNGNTSPQLAQTLAALRNLDDSSFKFVVQWAGQRDPGNPGVTVPDWNNAEYQIMQCSRYDRQAVFSWLRGNGRQRLYDRGATDAMIGRARFVDRGYTPATPSPLQQYRVLQLASDTLKGSTPPPSGISVSSGFALIARNGTTAIICLSFTNVAAQAATTVHFAFPLVDAQGNTVGTIDFYRKGTFSSNIAIDGPASGEGYFNPGFSNRSIYDNCVTSNQGTAALPLLQTRHVAFKVAGVTYADGSAWP